MILRAEDLVKKYKSRTVVKGVSVEVRQGEIVGLLGPNGAGKTTSFYMIVGLITPNGGRIFLDDTEITKEPVYRRAQLGVGYLAQEASVFRRLSVEDNIKAVLEMTKMSKQEQKIRLEEMLDEFGLQHIRKSLGIHPLSECRYSYLSAYAQFPEYLQQLSDPLPQTVRPAK